MIKRYTNFIIEFASLEEYTTDIQKANEKFNRENILNCLHVVSDIPGCEVKIADSVDKIKDQEKYIIQIWVNVSDIFSKKRFELEYFSKKNNVAGQDHMKQSILI